MDTEERRPKTLSDAALELKLTKSTVSRAISGHGRISKETKERVLEWAKQNNFTPSSIAKSLAKSKTYNIALLLPENVDNLFFHQCTLGITSTANEYDYDVLIVVDKGNNIDSVKRVVSNKKIDGIILTRILSKDKIISYLKKQGIPFLVIGSSSDKKIYQVDAHHKNIAYECTQKALKMGYKKIALLGGIENYLVNRDRASGFINALTEAGIQNAQNRIAWNIITNEKTQIAQVLISLVKENIDCILCMDDAICRLASMWLKENGYTIKLASFYDGPFLHDAENVLFAANVNHKELICTAAKIMMELLQNKENPPPRITRIEHRIEEFRN